MIKIKKTLLQVLSIPTSDSAADDFTAGLLAYYRFPAELVGGDAMETAKAQLSSLSDAETRVGDWHVMHLCLATLAGEDLLAYVEKAKTTYSSTDWKLLNQPANGSVGLLHALAMNPNPASAKMALQSLRSGFDMPWYTGGGYMGLYPAHLAALNGAAELAQELRPYGEAAPGVEHLSSFLYSSKTVESLLAGNGRRGTLRELLHANREPFGADLSDTLLQKTKCLLAGNELVSWKNLIAAMHKGTFRKHTKLPNREEKSPNGKTLRLSEVWIRGFLSPTSPMVRSWTPFHCAVIDPASTPDMLERLKAEHADLLGRKDSLGRSPLFYALACGTEPVIAWCIANAEGDDALRERDVHNRSLLMAAVMNPRNEAVAPYVEQLLTVDEFDADIFGMTAPIYALVNGKGELARNLYTGLVNLLGRTHAEKKALWQKCMSVAHVMEDKQTEKYLKQNRPKASERVWSLYELI